MKIPHLFQTGDKGLAVPDIVPEHRWAIEPQTDATVLITIKVDGLHVRVEHQGDKIYLDRQLTDGKWTQCNRTIPSDAPLFEAFDNYKDGLPEAAEYIAYGPDIKGNPQRADCHLMIKINPIESPLILYSNNVIPRRKGVLAQEFYDACKKELEEGDVEGIVFHLEKPTMKPIAYCQVTRKDFGLEWPVAEKKSTFKWCKLQKCGHVDDTTCSCECHTGTDTTPSNSISDKDKEVTGSCGMGYHKLCNMATCACTCHSSPTVKQMSRPCYQGAHRNCQLEACGCICHEST